jgi:two-component system, LytTR family, sensor kinase
VPNLRDTDFSYKRFIAVYVSGGFIFTFVQIYILRSFEVPVYIAVTDAVLNQSFILIASISTYNIIRFYRPARDNVFYTRLWVLLLTIGVTVGFHATVKLIFRDEEAYLQLIKAAKPVRYFINFLIITILSIFIYMWFYLKDARLKQTNLAVAEALTKEAELVSLRQQLQPHFLFNSLNSISALVGTRPEEARKMIHQLSEFLRGTLRKDDQKTFSLGDEIQHLQLYLDIEKVRFGHRLSTTISAAEGTLQAKIPPLILQPLVENAIKFGLYDIAGEVNISVDCTLDNNYLSVTITNPFDVKTSTPKKGAGFGLSSVQRRLYLLHARNDLLTIQHQDNLFTITVKIPQNI